VAAGGPELDTAIRAKVSATRRRPGMGSWPRDIELSQTDGSFRLMADRAFILSPGIVGARVQ